MGNIRVMLMSESSSQYLQFPLSVGKKWDLDYTAVIAGRSTPIKSKAEVTKLEDVTTPAGSFRAFKIERLEQVQAS